jgi:hypothetical protein
VCLKHALPNKWDGRRTRRRILDNWNRFWADRVFLVHRRAGISCCRRKRPRLGASTSHDRDIDNFRHRYLPFRRQRGSSEAVFKQTNEKSFAWGLSPQQLCGQLHRIRAPENVINELLQLLPLVRRALLASAGFPALSHVYLSSTLDRFAIFFGSRAQKNGGLSDLFPADTREETMDSSSTRRASVGSRASVTNDLGFQGPEVHT